MISVPLEPTDNETITSTIISEERTSILVADGREEEKCAVIEGGKSSTIHGGQDVSLILCESSTQILSENNHHICDPIEGRDGEFDVELCCGSSLHSLSVSSVSLTEDELESIQEFSFSVNEEEQGGSEEDCSPLSLTGHSEKPSAHHQPTIYGKVVKSIQKSIRKIFHTSAPTLFQSKEDSNSVASSPISSVSEEDSSPSIPTNPIHKTLLIDVAYGKPLLSMPHPSDVGKKCLVLDLDETLVHSTFQPVPNPDLVVPVHFGEGIYQPIYVCKRPGVDQFLEAVGELFEIVLFTASLATYADPVIDYLDPKGYIKYRLYREDCLQFQGLYIKDLSRLGRELDQILIIDNSPASYSMHPHNALACTSWFKDPHDRELEDRILPMLLKLKDSDNVTKWRNEHLQSIETPYIRSHSFLSSFVH